MAPPASKRQKTGHVSDEADSDSASFASFGDSNGADNGYDPQVRTRGKSTNGAGVKRGQERSETDQSSSDAEDNGPSHNVGLQPKGTPRSRWSRQPGSLAEAGPATFAAGTFKSNVFKLQVDELLQQIRPKRGKTEEAAEQVLHKLKEAIEDLPGRPSRSVDDAERELLKSKIAVPFPHPRPPKDAKYKLEYTKPTSINVVGSYPLNTSPRSKAGLELDMVVTMPTKLFQDKDYLNYRYFYRRSYYLACLAAGLKATFNKAFSMEYHNWHDNPLKPVLQVRPLRPIPGEASEEPALNWIINIIPCVPEAVFPSSKLSIDRNCVRTGDDLAPQTDASTHGLTATPFYNSSIRADMLTSSYLKLFHGTSKNCNAFKDACVLGGTWLQQRSFGSGFNSGGFGNFEWCALIAVLLQGGGAAGNPMLSNGYSSYQLLKATLQLLARKDLAKQPFDVGSDTAATTTLKNGTPVIWDGVRNHNILFKMTPWSYKLLRHEARTTMSMLSDQSCDSFEATFIFRTSNPLYRFDCFLNLGPSASHHLRSETDQDPWNQLRDLYGTVRKATGDRVTLINIIQSKSESWSLGSARPQPIRTEEGVNLGLLVNPDTVNRAVDHGPAAEDKAETLQFRAFWGDKAELRRFKDGSIRESLVWATNLSGQSVLEQILRYALHKHYPSFSSGAIFSRFGNDARAMLPKAEDLTPFTPLMDAYKQLETDIRSLDDLPLSIRQIMSADPQLRYSSINPPMMKGASVPANVVLQFEGSGRWPDDIVAIQRTKIAFLLNLGNSLSTSVEALTTRVGLENSEHDLLNQAFLDVVYGSGASFRIRIHHEREQYLLERQLRDKSIEPRVKEAAALSLAKYRRDYIKTPAHSQAIARLCSRFPALSGTIRLLKNWFASHLLDNHIADEVVELLAVHTFVQPWPWQAPSSVQTGFHRTLFRLSRWDWRSDPLIVDLSGSGELKQAEMRSIGTKFEAWRKLDPSLNRVILFAASSVDQDGTTWTDGQPIKAIAARMTALARAATAETDEKSVTLQCGSLFASSLTDFDFTIHLDPVRIGKKKRSRRSGVNGTVFKNLEVDDVHGDTNLIGLDPVQDFVDDLTKSYGSAVLFCSGGYERPVIAGLWHPHTGPRSWRLNIAYSTTPKTSGTKEDVQAEINREGILAEIARLGGDLIERINVKERR